MTHPDTVEGLIDSLHLSRIDENLARSEAEELRARVATLEAALKQYADPANWICSRCVGQCIGHAKPCIPDVWDGENDGPDFAREALGLPR